MALRVTRTQARALQMRIDGGVDDVTPKRRRGNEEAQHQAALFSRRQELLARYAELRWMFATLNGIFIPAPLKRQVAESGLVAGVLDVWVPVARDDPDGTHYCGMVLELKKLKQGRPSPAQREWAAHLVGQGWRVYFPAGVVDAWWCCACYLGIAGTDHWAPDLQRQEEFIRQTSR